MSCSFSIDFIKVSTAPSKSSTSSDLITFLSSKTSSDSLDVKTPGESINCT